MSVSERWSPAPPARITTRTLNPAMLTLMAGLFLRMHDGWRGYDDTPIIDN